MIAWARKTKGRLAHAWDLSREYRTGKRISFCGAWARKGGRLMWKSGEPRCRRCVSAFEDLGRWSKWKR